MHINVVGPETGIDPDVSTFPSSNLSSLLLSCGYLYYDIYNRVLFHDLVLDHDPLLLRTYHLSLLCFFE